MSTDLTIKNAFVYDQSAANKEKDSKQSASQQKEESTSSYNVATALLPLNVIKDFDKLKEEEVPQVLTLIVKLSMDALTKYQQKDLLALDAHSGAFDCQLVAFKMLNLIQSESLKKEAEVLLEKLKDLPKKIVEQRELLAKKNARKLCDGLMTPATFLRERFESIKISEEMDYLLKARLLTVIKYEDEKGNDKVVISQLEIFSKPFDSTIRHKIVGYAQAALSERSISYVRSEASKIAIVAGKELAMINKMLEPAAIKQEGDTKYLDTYPAKSLSCGLYNLKAVLLRLCEQESVLVVKQTVYARKKVEGERPLPLLFRATKGGEFLNIPDIECEEKEKEKENEKDKKESLSGNNPVIVIEGDIPAGTNRDVLKNTLEKVGLYNYLLGCAVQEPPYGTKLPLAIAPYEEAQAEIVDYQKKSLVFGCVKDKNLIFDLKHIYCNLLGKELALAKKM